MLISRLAVFRRGVQRLIAGFLSRVFSAQVYIEHPCRGKTIDAEEFFGIAQPAQDVEVGQQLKLEAMLEQDRIELSVTGLIINNDAKRLAAVGSVAEIDPIN